MSKTRDANLVRMIFYPMAGSVEQQFGNLIETLYWIEMTNPFPREVDAWLRSSYGLSASFARDVYTVLFVSSGLVIIENGRCRLTLDGQSVLVTQSPVRLLEIFEKTFAGVATFLEVLRDHPYLKSDKLNALWFNIAKERFPKIRGWSKRTLDNQCRHRINWLRTMGFIQLANGIYSLSDGGWKFTKQTPPESIAIQQNEVIEQETELARIALGTFNTFDSNAEKTLSLRRSYARDRAFRRLVTSQYENNCVVCEFCMGTPDGQFEAEAAHIVPKRQRGTDDPRNGICLCGTCHWLFDHGVVSIDAKKLKVITASFIAGTHPEQSAKRVLRYLGKKVRPPANIEYSPAREALEWHNERIFLG